MNYNKKKLYTLFTLLLFILGNAIFADGPVINSISISGLRRTTENTIRKIILPIRAGAPYTEETDEIIIQKLRATGIFNPEIRIVSRMAENLVDIEIQVKDRWTLIPIPIVSIGGNDSWKAGVLVIEGNLLGLNKTLGLGYFYGSEGWSLLSFYSNPLILQTDMTLTASLTAGLDETSDLSVTEETLREYQSDTLGLGLGLEYPLSDRFFVTGSWEYDRSILRTKSTEGTVPPDTESTGVSGEIKWKDLYYDIPYEKGILAKASYTWNFGLNNTDSYSSAETDITGSFTPWLNHLIKMTISGGWGDLPIQKEFRLGGLPGTRILPMNKIAADEFAVSSFSYNIPLLNFSGGTLSAKTLYEAGLFKSETVESTLFHGPGVGLELFINDLAIPAVQMDLGWNLETGRYQFSAGIGMGGGNPD